MNASNSYILLGALGSDGSRVNNSGLFGDEGEGQGITRRPNAGELHGTAAARTSTIRAARPERAPSNGGSLRL